MKIDKIYGEIRNIEQAQDFAGENCETLITKESRL